MGTLAGPIPSCEDETNAHCVGEDADLSQEGINKCLEGLSEKSARCTTSSSMMKACMPTWRMVVSMVPRPRTARPCRASSNGRKAGGPQ